jgi:hypothetical protein
MPHLNFAVKLLLLTSLLTVAAVARASAQGNCDRACLTGFLDGWFKGLVSNSTSGMPVAKDVKITQNGQIATLAATFWDSADSVPYRWDIANSRLGDTAAAAVIRNADGTMTMLSVRLKVKSGAITEIETIKANKGDADGLWGPETLLQKGVSPALQLSIREAERDSYYRLIAAAEGYWRAASDHWLRAQRRVRLRRRRVRCRPFHRPQSVGPAIPGCG